ncbi:MAG: FoF1 ATP synthase subunit gamma, partial [Anaerovoracaceae bacterium]
LIKEAEAEMISDPEAPLIVAIGTKGRDYFGKRGYEIYSEMDAPPETISFLEAKELSKPILEMYNRGEIDEVVLIYTSYVSTLEQQVKNLTLLPFTVEADPEIIKHERPVEYEPSVEEVFNYLVPKYVEIILYGAIVESATCEHAARRMAMESATDNARDMMENLSLYYNRARQSAITDEIIEIVAGSEAQK